MPATLSAYEHGSAAVQRLIARDDLRVGTDLFNASAGFAIAAAAHHPADPFAATRKDGDSDMVVEARFLRNLARHLDAVATEFETGNGVPATRSAR